MRTDTTTIVEPGTANREACTVVRCIKEERRERERESTNSANVLNWVKSEML